MYAHPAHNYRMGEYVTHHDNGTECSKRRMYVRLYPNTSHEESMSGPGSNVMSAIKSAMDQLYNYDAISHYSLQMFDTDQYGYPDINTYESGWKDRFMNWLDNGSSNGTGKNLREAYIGVHLFLHSQSCGTNTAGAEYADDCSTSDGYSAFSRGVAAWTGAECVQTDLEAASAIQEPLHCFIQYKRNYVQDLMGGTNTNHEHALGEVRDFTVTPMLAYHENEVRDEGDCIGDRTEADKYGTTLTSCTKDAVDYISRNQCITQNEPASCNNL